METNSGDGSGGEETASECQGGGEVITRESTFPQKRHRDTLCIVTASHLGNTFFQKCQPVEDAAVNILQSGKTLRLSTVAHPVCCELWRNKISQFSSRLSTTVCACRCGRTPQIKHKLLPQHTADTKTTFDWVVQSAESKPSPISPVRPASHHQLVQTTTTLKKLCNK